MNKAQKRYYNSLKGTKNKIIFLQQLITEKNKQIKYLGAKIKEFTSSASSGQDEKGKPQQPQ